MSGLSSQLPSSPSSCGTSSDDKGWWTDSYGTMHYECEVRVEVAGEDLGSFKIDGGAHPELKYFREGVAYFCPACGDIWARLRVLGFKQHQETFRCLIISCEKHYDQWNEAGSLLGPQMDSLINYLPPAALRREFYLYLNKGTEK